MIYPKFLKENNRIGVPAPSAGADNKTKAKFENSIKNMEKLGYKIQASKNLLKCEKGRSSSAIERADEINRMFYSKDIDIILCATGGEFLVEILPYINFEIIKTNPKLISGFSDQTGLLYPITTKYDIATIYGKNFSSFGMENFHKSQYDFLEIIKGNIIEQESFELYEEEQKAGITGLEGYNLTKKVYWNTLNNKEVTLNGRIVGGCFDIIAELAGTKYDGINEFNKKYKNDGVIWYFDNCELSLNETIRTLWKLDELGYFKYTKGVIFGRFGVETDYFGYGVEECLKDSVLSKKNIEVVYNADISHKPPCLTIINGSIANVNVNNGKGKISFELK